MCKGKVKLKKNARISSQETKGQIAQGMGINMLLSNIQPLDIAIFPRNKTSFHIYIHLKSALPVEMVQEMIASGN